MNLSTSLDSVFPIFPNYWETSIFHLFTWETGKREKAKEPIPVINLLGLVESQEIMGIPDFCTLPLIKEKYMLPPFLKYLKFLEKNTYY